jgi:uncharacterized protein DUF998
MERKLLLICGVLASLVYIGTDILAAALYAGYSFRDQAVSELFAIGAPTSRLVVPLFTLSSALLLPFALGVWSASGRSRALRVMAFMIAGNAVDSLVLWNFFPMHMRGVEPTFTDTMHLILAINPFVLLSIGFGAAAFRNWFRFYSLGTILALFVPALFAFMYVSQVGANQPTPWLGLTERISQYSFQLWQAVLAVVLLRVRGSAAPKDVKEKATLTQTQNRRPELTMTQNALLICGILASLLYVGSDIVAAIRWEGYSYIDQSVSELRASGAPTRPLLVPILFLYAMLEIAFGLGVRGVAGQKRALSIAGALLIGLGIVDLAAFFFPMHLRGAEFNLMDTMHITLTVVTVLLILLVIGFGSVADGNRFRLYSISTILILILCGAWAFMDGPRIAANLPTPWVGVRERINIYGYMLWMAVLAIALLRVQVERHRDGT